MVKAMFKKGLVVAIITLFIGMSFIPTVTSIQSENVNTINIYSIENLEDSRWRFFLFGHITNIEIFEYENLTLMNATALYIRGIVLNFFRNYPNIPFPIRWIGDQFCIPYEWVKIMVPTLTGNHFIIAFGTTDI